ncbi:MAG: NADH-ubiquinone oxidoreductase-F iron-sulfur binding region domain-containing protein [Actinomycetota bacterium]|nr:NADH-ubiquinone oxidoreductase-F iron-sulfur binding region domain-containing protein [Actinomycetota bacterium]
MKEGCSVTLAIDFFKAFLAEKMCAKCLPCMMGMAQILGILEDISRGSGKEEDLEVLAHLASQIVDTARCKLGRDAAEFLAASLENHREDYLEHITNKTCSSSFCDEITCLKIEPSACTICGACKEVCPEDAIVGEGLVAYLADNRPMKIRTKRCTRCGRCQEVCITGAIEIV